MNGVRDKIQEAFRDGESSIDLTGYFITNERGPHMPLQHIMLGPMLRQYVIVKVKLPIMKALMTGKTFAEVVATLITSVGRLPKIRRENTLVANAHILLEKKEKLLSRLNIPQREVMLRSACDMLIAEYEHDPVYSFIFDYLLFELVKEVNSGNWKPRNMDCPVPKFWTGNKIGEE